MVTIQLTSDQAVVLRETLERFVSNLGHEIGNTDLMDYRNHLKARKKALLDVIGQLPGKAA
jgi:hypothetical protein